MSVPQDIQFLNWYVGTLITIISIIGSFLIWKIKEDYENYKIEKTNQRKIISDTKQEIHDIMKTLEITREKIILDLNYLKEAVKHIPSLQNQVSKIELDLARTSEQIKFLQKSLEHIENLGKIIKIKGQQ
jgi:regulatory protein YycH of two-component signal transduction system YycFG